MCLVCDGWTDDEIYAEYDDLIARYGWMVQHIGGGSVRRPPWAYTIGLSAGFGHPELVVVGLSMETSCSLLNDLGRRIAAGERFEPGSAAANPSGALEVTFGGVNPLHWEGPVLVVWRDYYESRGLTPDQEALQVVLPPAMAAPRARPWQPCLHDPDCLLGRDDEGDDRHPFNQHRRRRRPPRR